MVKVTIRMETASGHVIEVCVRDPEKSAVQLDYDLAGRDRMPLGLPWRPWSLAFACGWTNAFKMTVSELAPPRRLGRRVLT